MNKKYFLIAVMFLAVGLAFLPKDHAYAFDSLTPSAYIVPDSISVTTDGQLDVQFHKVQLGLGGYGIGNAWVVATINGTPTSSDLVTIAGSNGGYYGSWGAAGITGSLERGGGCAGSLNYDYYSPLSQTPFSEDWIAGEVYDESSHSYVSAANITRTTPIYFTYATWASGYFCADNTLSAQESVEYNINSINTLFGFQYVTPANSATIGNFPNWQGIITNNSSSPISGVITYSFGLSTSTLNSQVSSTFYVNPLSQDSLATPNNFSFVTPQLTTDQQWFYQAELVSASSGVDLTFPPQTFTISPNGNNCDVPSAVNLLSPFPSSTIVNDFSQWRVNTPDLLEGCSYNVNVSFTPQIGSLTGGTDSLVVNPTPEFNPSSVSVTKGKNLWLFYNATTTQFNYVVTLSNQADGYILGSEVGSFNLGFSSSSANTTPPNFDPNAQCGGTCSGFGTLGGGNLISQVVSSSIEGCGASPSSTFAIADQLTYVFCQISTNLIFPHDWSQTLVANAFNLLKSDPPFVYVYGSLSDIQNAAMGVASSSATDLSVSFAPMGTYNIIPQTPLKIIDNTAFGSLSASSTLDKSVHTQLFQVEDYLYVIFLVTFIVLVVTGGRSAQKNKHTHK